MKIIARIYNGFKEKFGIPRQSGIIGTRSRIVFEKEYRNPDALRGIEEFSYLWLIWNFSESEREGFCPTVRPPRLGGNRRMGVFATRSPFRPNPIGLSSVRLVGIEQTEGEGTVLIVEGADLLSGTPIYDIKPYLAYADSHPDATGGFADAVRGYEAEVVFPEALQSHLTDEQLDTVLALLRHDPRPSYKNGNEERIYHLSYDGVEIDFKEEDGRLCVIDVRK